MALTQIRGDTQIKAATITNAEIAAAAAIASTKLATWTANRNAGAFKLTNMAPGTTTGDAVTYEQLIAVAAGSGKEACRLATTANVTLSGTQTIDGIAGSVDDRIFVKSQTAPAENGPYLMKSGAWVRTTDADTWNELVSAIIPISEGTVNADSVWLITADRGGTLNTTAVTSVQLPGPSDILAGDGLVRTGKIIDFVTGDASLTVAANSVIVHLDAAGAITLSGSGIAVAVGSATGLQISSNTLGIKLDGSTLTLSSSGIKVTTPTPIFVTRETPSGTIAGGTVFTLANTPTTGSEEVFLNGILQEAGGEDYAISGATITFVGALSSGDRLRVNYRR